MRLTKYTDYALRVLISLGRSQASTIQAIAAAQHISRNHLMKIVHDLAKLGYVETARGRGGGLRLARAPQDIRVGDLVRDTEESLAVVECLDDGYAGGCRLHSTCGLKGVLHGAQRAFLAELDRYTLADLLPPPERPVPVKFVKSRADAPAR